jgi:hypothetical protein
LRASGAIDEAFGNSLLDYGIVNLSLLSDDRIVAAGARSPGGIYDDDLGFAAAVRLDANGEIEARFDAILLHEFDASKLSGFVSNAAVQPDGTMVLSGRFDTWAGVPRSGLVRLTAEGKVDPTFGPDWQDTRAFGPQVIAFGNGETLIFGNGVSAYGVSLPGVTKTLGESAAPFAPVVARQSPSTAAKAGGSLTLFADVAAIPGPLLRWQKNGTDLPGENLMALRFASVTPGDAGTYRLLATNDLGEIVTEEMVVEVLCIRRWIPPWKP